MKSLVFDLDDTLLMSNTYKQYTDIVPNQRLTDILKNLIVRPLNHCPQRFFCFSHLKLCEV